MKFSLATKIIAACAGCMLATASFSHVVLEDGAAPAGSGYKAVFQVSHGCNGSATTGLSVQIPAGFQGAKPYPKAGWTLSVKLAKLAKPYDSHGKQVREDVSLVSWTAAAKDAALPDAYVDDFMLRGQLPETAGPLWFKVLQTCESGSVNWSDIPASGTSTQGLKSPAALLQVSAAAQADALTAPGQPVQVRQGWVRSTVPGQKGSGAFMKITAQTATRLVGVATPVAGVAEVHEMKMEGDVMTMRRVAGIDLPAGKTVELKSGAFHVMLMDLKQALPAGSTVPLTLIFKDAKGLESRLELKLPVATTAPGAAAASGPAEAHDHKH